MRDDRKRVPGSEKLTRPEDLKSLAKFLGNIKKTQEEHTELDNENVGIPGRDTGYIPKIDKLSEESVQLLDGKKDVVGLSDSAISLKGNFKEVSIGDSRIGLEDKREVSLSDYLDQLEDSDKIIENLPDSVIGLEDNERETELDNTRLDIAVSGIDGLGEDVIGLDVPENIDINKKRLDLAQDKEINSLDDTLIAVVGEAVNIDGLKRYRLENKDEREVELSNSKVGLNVGKEATLDNHREDINVEKDVELEDKRENLQDDREAEIKEDRLDLKDIKELEELNKERVSGPKIDDSELDDTRLDIEVSGVDNLGEERINKPDGDKEIESLYDNSLEKPVNDRDTEWDGESLYDSAIQAPDLEGEYKELLNADDLTKYQAILDMADNLGGWGSKIASLVSAYLSQDNISADRAKQFDSELKKLLNQMAFLKRSYEESERKAQLFNQVLENPVRGNIETGETAYYADKVFDGMRREGTVKRPDPENTDTYIAGSGNPAEEKEYSLGEKLLKLYKNPAVGDNKKGYITIPKFQLPARELLDALNPSNYLRYGAEELFNLWDPSTKIERLLKPTLLNETIALLFLAREKLEKLAKANRDRLPGDDAGLLSDLASSGVSGALENLKDNALSALQNTFEGSTGIEKLNPINRPKIDAETGLKKHTVQFEKGNNRQDNRDDRPGEKFGKAITRALIGNLADDSFYRSSNYYNFKDNYLMGEGIQVTLSDLCDWKGIFPSSVEMLLEILKQAPNITLPNKFGTQEYGKYGSMTLDTNSYWEITMTPFCQIYMNGGYSFLPAIEEINLQNELSHGVRTDYSKWIPISNFELEKSKLTSKSLGLYDGEINYPISAELTNELRMTIVDDQYKSWRNYFQKCSDVSVYNSEAHSRSYYLEENRSQVTVPTIIDKTSYAAASYKNVTFLIGIYLMTPQFSTIRRFNLLCVLRDYQESYAGDIDAGGYDLNITFSIVGENPPDQLAMRDISDVEGYSNPYQYNNSIIGDNPKPINANDVTGKIGLLKPDPPSVPKMLLNSNILTI